MNRKKAESKRKKFHLNRIAFLFPIIFYAIYAVVYLIIFPDAYGTGLHLNNWLFNNPEHLLSILQNPGKVLLSTGKFYYIFYGQDSLLHYFIWDGQSKTKNRNIIRRLCSVEGNHIKKPCR